MPPLWIFTDQTRLPDPRAVLAGLPKGLCGVVLRAGRGIDPVIADGIALLCRQRQFVLVVAGAPWLAARLRAGRHFAGGSRDRPFGFGRGRFTTAAAHNPAELMQARRLSVDAVFLSPVFPTASHPGAPSLGAGRWAAMAGRQKQPVLALGGVSAGSVRRLPRFCAGAGMIGAARLGI